MWGQQWGSGANDSAGMSQVVCQDCGTNYLLVSSDELEKGIETGRFTRGEKVKQSNGNSFNPGLDYYETQIYGVCRKCSVVNQPLENELNAQRKRIQDKIAFLRKRRKDLTFERIVATAVDEEFDPRNEPNEAFRAYLLERGGSTPTEKFDGVRKWFRALFGPHAGGAA